MPPENSHPPAPTGHPAAGGSDAGVPGVPGQDGWWPVCASTEVGRTPRRVVAGRTAWTAWRPSPDAAAQVVAELCPHRWVRLAAGTVRADGALQCAYHGWAFDGTGACVEVPSNGPAAAPPPRADLARPWGVQERDGRLWVAPVDPDGAGADRGPAPRVGAPSAQPAPAPSAQPAPESGGQPGPDLLTNLDPALDHGWHPVARCEEVGGAALTVRLLGRSLRLHREPGGDLRAEPAPAALAEHLGLVWVAPRPPAADLLPCPDAEHPAFSRGVLRPERSTSAAGVLAENFLDVAHFPFVHAATFGAAEARVVEPFEVSADAVGLTSTQEQWFDNPQDPAVARGDRPLRQRRRATYTYRWPFQLLLRLEELDAGSIKTIVFSLQPEDEGSTRIHTTMLLHGLGEQEVPDERTVAEEVAFEARVLAEDLALQQAMTVPGLPLRLRAELHVRSDRSGVALRRVLAGVRARVPS